MSNASLKEQLQAVASQIVDVAPKKQHQPSQHRPQQHKPVQKVHSRPPQVTAKKPKPKWLEYAQYGVELLRVYFPAAFREANDIKPLKKGIKEDLIRRLSTIENIVTEDKACMVKSLAYYVNTAIYHKAVIEGVQRVDLDGKPAETVTAEEAKYSLDRNQAKQQAKQYVSHSR